MKKNVNVACIINTIEKTITVSKDFLRKAGKVGTPEYNELLIAQRDYPSFTLEVRTIKKAQSEKPHIGYKEMQNYISTFSDAGARLATYEKVKKISRIQRSPYNYVRDWFLLTYMGWERDNEKNKIIPGKDNSENMNRILGITENIAEEVAA